MVKTPDAIVGSVIDGRYKISRRIARGGMATVYEGYDQRLERPVAIKVMHPHLAESPDFVARFRREARAAAKLTHPGVVAVYDQGTLGEIPYLVMEYVPGEDLRSLMHHTERNAPLGTALRILELVLEAVGAAHRSGMVHRDIKPENVLIDTRSTDLRIKVADFGLARAVTEATMASTGTVLGTVAYLAPEIVTEGIADPRSDVYACGILLYELLLGHPPYTSDIPIRVAFQHINEDVPPPSRQATWIPKEVDEVITSFTARDPNARPADADAARALLLSTCMNISDALLEKSEPKPVATSQSEQTATSFSENSSEIKSANQITNPPDSSSLHTKQVNNPNGVPTGNKAISTTPKPDSQKDDRTGNKTTTSLDLSTIYTPTQVFSAPRSTVSASTVSASTVSNSAVSTPLKKDLSTSKNEKSNKNFPVNKPSKPRKRKVWPILLALLCVIALSATGVWYFWFGPGAGIVVPDLAGKTPQVAIAELQKLGLEASPIEKFDDNVEKGLVINTDPAAGKRQKPKQGSVKLYTSKGVEMVIVPSFASQSLEQYRKLLESSKLHPGKEVEEYHDSVPKGSIIKVDPAENQQVKHDSKVNITISKGRQPVTIPALTGKTREEAAKALSDLGLKMKVIEEHSDSVAKDLVINQSPNTGPGYRGDEVTINISLGPEIIEVPNVRSMNKDRAVELLEGLGFKVETKRGVLNLFNLVSFQSATPGESIPKGSTIVLTID